MATEELYLALERCFDEGRTPDAALAAALENDAELREYEETLQQLRAAVPYIPSPKIEDAQFRVFMDGIRTGMQEERKPAFGRWWAALSMAAASFVIASSMFYIFAGEPANVSATEVENYSTEIQGAKTETFINDDGLTTVWVYQPGDDL